MWWLLVVVPAWAGVAWLTGEVAARHERDRIQWVVLGLLFPGGALVALLLGFPRSDTAHGAVPQDVQEALRHNRMAKALLGEPGQTTEALAERFGISPREARGELRSLRLLGLARRDDDRWTLTPRARSALDASRGVDVDDAG